MALLLSASMGLSISSCAVASAPASDDGTFNIVTSFYPMQILVMNIADGIDGVSVECMSEPNLGCIHDHVFSTEDLMSIEGADVYVENGLELETFNDRILSAYPGLQIIEAASRVTDAPSDEDEVNGHVWTSIDDYVLEINEVADRLSEIDPDHASSYRANADAYIDRVTGLTSDYSDVLASLEGRSVLVLDETLPSFCVYAGMNYTTIETDHEQSALSAGDIRETIEFMTANGVTAIFVSADSEADIANTIAEESGAVIYELNTCMTGEVTADAYIDQMASNLELLGAMG